MANKNKNTNELVFDRDDATSELEEITLQHALTGARSDSVEEDEDTFDIARIPGKADSGTTGGDSAAAQAEIERLQYDAEQLRSELSGLQSELQAREEISADLNRRIADLEAQLESRGSSLRQRDQVIGDLKAEIRKRAAHARDTEAAQKTQLAELERLQMELTTLREDHDSLAQAAEEAGPSQADVARQSGSPPAGTENMPAQLARTEAYADELRRRLSDKAEQAEWLEKDLQHTRMELHDKVAALERVGEQLGDALEEKRALAEEIALMRQRHDEETGSLKERLADLEDALGRNTLINEQLAADLEEGNAYRERMESMLNQSDDDYRTRIAELEARLAETTEEKNRLEEQLASHNDAVNSLIKDLESHDESLGPMGLAPPDAVAPRDRINRMLVGRIGEQELRFPLFKNRLTIGRTQQNDIQLNLPYISRRHAVVITEGNAARVIDWGSRNGVFVNSERITEHFLKSGDRITIGNANFRYEERPRRDS
jgi:chromosome segregation ATPase